MSDGHPFERLTPDVMQDAMDDHGWLTDGRFLTLNSYENRVFQVGQDEGEPVIAKFYRPQRWSDAQILEEHAFCQELVEHELPVVAPLSREGTTLFQAGEFRFSVYPRRGGHAPALDDPDTLLVLGRTLARLHNVGAARAFQTRPTLSIDSFGHDSVRFLTEHFIPDDLRAAWDSLTRDVLAEVEALFRACPDVPLLRVHGDFHGGNVLWRDDMPNLVDLDDARMAPAMQDIWMLLSGDHLQQQSQLAEIIEGYEEFRDFPVRELRLVEALRTLRMLYFAAWIGQRWDDPAFPRVFSWFDTPRYWGDLILDLREQLANMQGEPLTRPAP